MKRKKEYDDLLPLNAIYAAEDSVIAALKRGGPVDFFGSAIDLDGCVFREYTPLQIPFVQGMVSGLWAQQRGDMPPPSLRLSDKAFVKATYTRSKHEIMLPRSRWALNDLVVLHELAHALGGLDHDQRSSHGKTWRKEYAHLVARVCGTEAGVLLMASMDL
jgi:putative metallohydrolase (TIGR04338 family)